MAKKLLERAFKPECFDLRLDSGKLEPEERARQLIALTDSREPPRAFDLLREQLIGVSIK